MPSIGWLASTHVFVADADHGVEITLYYLLPATPCFRQLFLLHVPTLTTVVDSQFGKPRVGPKRVNTCIESTVAQTITKLGVGLVYGPQLRINATG